MAESLSREDAEAFAPEALEYVQTHGGAFNKRPDLVLGFARELGMDVKSADAAISKMQAEQGDSLRSYGVNYLFRSRL